MDATDTNGGDTDVSMFRKVLAAPGPVVTDDLGAWRRSIGVLARKYDAELTDPEVVAIPEVAVWFRCHEADIILNTTDVVLEEDTPDMPYPHRIGRYDEILSASLGWEPAVQL